MAFLKEQPIPHWHRAHVDAGVMLELRADRGPGEGISGVFPRGLCCREPGSDPRQWSDGQCVIPTQELPP